MSGSTDALVGTVVTVRDADGRPVQVARENGGVMVQASKTAPQGRIRLNAAARETFLRAFTAAEPPACARDGGYPDIEAGITGRLERFLCDLDLLGTMLFGGREFRSLYLEEARALGYADTSPAVLLRAEDEQAVFEISIGVTAREVRRAPAPLAAQAAPAAEASGGD